MITPKTILLAALATLALSSCTNQEDPAADRNNSLLPADRVIRVSATAANNHLVPTRAGVNTEQLNGFTLTIANAQAPDYSYNNVSMQKDGGGRWNAYKATDNTYIPFTLLWSNASHPVMVTAYHPYIAEGSITDGVITRGVVDDQTSIDESALSDLLWAQNEVTPANAEAEASNDIHYDRNTQHLVVKMNHLLSKLRINLKYGSALTQNGAKPELTKATLMGTRVIYQFTPATGAVKVDTDYDPLNIAMSIATETPTDGYHAACEAIVVPQHTDFTLRFIVDGCTYEYAYKATPAAQPTFAGGTLYTLDITLGPDQFLGKMAGIDWKAE